MRSAIGTTLVLGAVVGLAAQTREPRGGGVFSPDYDYNITGRWTFSSLPTVTGSSLVTGPTSSTDDAIVRFSGTTGAVIQGYTSNAPTISDSGEPYFRGQATFKAAHSFDSSILFTSLGAASDVAPQSMRWIQTDLAMPYGLGTYVNNTGAFYTGKFITISNKRVDVNGAIMGVSATSDGQEGTMLSITPDINGPALGIEASGAPTGSLKDQAAIAFYDLDTGIGGNTPYSSGYHAKKSMVSGNGTWSWGANLSTDPNANYETRLAPNFVSASAKGLLLTANASIAVLDCRRRRESRPRLLQRVKLDGGWQMTGLLKAAAAGVLGFVLAWSAWHVYLDHRIWHDLLSQMAQQQRSASGDRK
jgi:hypothetical protein